MELETNNGAERYDSWNPRAGPGIRAGPERDLRNILRAQLRIELLCAGAVGGRENAGSGGRPDGGKWADVASHPGLADHQPGAYRRPGAVGGRQCMLPVG